MGDTTPGVLTPTKLTQVFRVIMFDIYERKEDIPRFKFVFAQPHTHTNFYSLWTVDCFAEKRQLAIEKALSTESIIACFEGSGWLDGFTDSIEINIPGSAQKCFLFFQRKFSEYPVFFQEIVTAFNIMIDRIPPVIWRDVYSKLITPTIEMAALSLLEENEYREVDTKIFTELSALGYERADAKGCIVFSDTNENFEGVSLAPHLDLQFSLSNCRQLRKLLEVSDDTNPMIIQEQRGSLLVEGDDKGPIFFGKIVTGFGCISTASTKILFKGHMWWELHQHEKAILVYRSGGYKMPSDNVAQSGILEKCFDLFEDTECDANSLSNIAECLLKQERGTSILVTNAAEETTTRLSRAKRGFPITPIKLIDAEGIPDAEMLGKLSSIDGCLIFDQNGMCHGIGMILDGQAVTPGSSARGARYNSMKNYVAWRKIFKETEANLVLIISEDKTVDIFSSKDDFPICVNSNS